jgi:hypothetical protein
MLVDCPRGLSTWSPPEGVERPFTAAIFKARGIGLAEELRIRDRHKRNLTAGALRRERAPQCPTCSHRSRAMPLYETYEYVCRWGHLTRGEDMIRGRAR